MANEFDFGFTAVDEVPSEAPQQTVAPTQNNDEIMDKLAQLEMKILNADNSGMVNEHRQLIESDVSNKLRDVEDLVLPLLYNLQKNPEKEYIKWPDRTAKIEAFEDHIRKIIE